MTAPLVPLALALAGGVALGLEVAAPAWIVPAGIILAILVLAGVRAGSGVAPSGAALLLVALAGWARVGLPDPLPAVTGIRAGSARVEGIIGADPEREGPRTRFPLLLERVVEEAGSRPARGWLPVQIYGPPVPLRAGERVQLVLQLTAPRPFRNPPGSPAPAVRPPTGPGWLATGRTDAVERVPDGPLPWWLEARLWVHRIVTRELPPISGALFEGLLVGERRRLPAPVLADFRAAGVFHVLAISGFNVGLVVGAAFVVLRGLRIPARPAALLTLGGLAAFVGVVGGQPSVLRAGVMGGLVLAAQLLGRESSVWNSLAAALLALLLVEPDGLRQPGLQLSFAATAGILHLGLPLGRRLARHLPPAIAGALGVSLGAQLAVTPLMLAHWSQLSLIGVAANLLVVPLAATLTVLGCFALVLATLSESLAHWLFQTLWALLVVLRLLVRLLASVPWAVVHVPTPPAWILGGMAAVLLLAPAATTGRRRILVAALALGSIGGLVHLALPDGRLRILMADVGQGEAIVVRGPDGRTLLIDTGGGGPGRSDRGERVVLPLLHRLGVRRLDVLAITHDDPDHAGGVAAILEGIPVEEVWTPAGTDAGPWQTPRRSSRIGHRALARGDRLWLGPLLVTVLHPERPGLDDGTTRRDDNDRSLVLRIEWGLAAAIFTGDAEARAERDLVAAALPLRGPVLKVGHHGSRQASSRPFLSAVRPRLALISVGGRNPFGHPSPEVLGRLHEAGAAIYRTDADGAVEVISDAERVWVRGWARPGTPAEAFPLRGAP